MSQLLKQSLLSQWWSHCIKPLTFASTKNRMTRIEEILIDNLSRYQEMVTSVDNRKINQQELDAWISAWITGFSVGSVRNGGDFLDGEEIRKLCNFLMENSEVAKEVEILSVDLRGTVLSLAK